MMELSYRRHRFPPVVIQHAVWLYLRLETGSHMTLRWREPDSNHRSRSCERLFWALPIGDGGTKGGATYSGPRRRCLPGVAPHSLSLRGGTASSIRLPPPVSPSPQRIRARGRKVVSEVVGRNRPISQKAGSGGHPGSASVLWLADLGHALVQRQANFHLKFLAADELVYKRRVPPNQSRASGLPSIPTL